MPYVDKRKLGKDEKELASLSLELLASELLVLLKDYHGSSAMVHVYYDRDGAPTMSCNLFTNYSKGATKCANEPEVRLKKRFREDER